MPVQLLAHAVRRRFNPRAAPDFGARDLLGMGVGIVAIGGFIWLVHRDLKAATTLRPGTPTGPTEPDRPGPRPEPVFPSAIETKQVGVELALGDSGPEPWPVFVDVLGSGSSLSSTSRMQVTSKLPVDVSVAINTRPGDVLTSPSGQYRALIEDIGFAQSTKLKGATLLQGQYGVSPELRFRISSPARSQDVDDANIALHVRYSWRDQGGTLHSDTVPLGIFASQA